MASIINHEEMQITPTTGLFHIHYNDSNFKNKCYQGYKKKMGTLSCASDRGNKDGTNSVQSILEAS